MVFGFGEHHKDEQVAYNSFYEGGDDQDYEGNKLHEGIAGAAAFYAMKKYEERREADGQQDHAFAREMLAAVTGAEVDKLAERKGMDYEQRERAKEAARERANQMYETNYMQGGAGGDYSSGGGGYAGGGGGYGGGQGGYDQQQQGYRGPEGGYQQQMNQGMAAEQGFGDPGYNQGGDYQGGGGGGGGYEGGRGRYEAGGYDQQSGGY